MHQETILSNSTVETDYRHSSSKYEQKKHNKSPYRNLLLMGLAHVPIMYVIMFAMVDTMGDIYQNLNTFYMAVMMAAPMVAIMPIMMREMYQDKRKNILVIFGSLLVLIAAFAGIRYQSAIGDTQFIKSMIPHHSGAILMCDQAKLLDPELKALCTDISAAQREEINQMEKILDRL